MSERVLFPDVAEIALNVIADGLAADDATVPVGNVVPDDRPPSFVVAQVIGGTRRNIVMESSLLVVECWADNVPAALDLAQLTRSYLFALKGTSVDDVQVYDVADVEGPADVTDPLSDQPRFTYTIELTVRGRKA